MGLRRNPTSVLAHSNDDSVFHVSSCFLRFVRINFNIQECEQIHLTPLLSGLLHTILTYPKLPLLVPLFVVPARFCALHEPIHGHRCAVTLPMCQNNHLPGCLACAQHRHLELRWEFYNSFGISTEAEAEASRLRLGGGLCVLERDDTAGLE